MKVEAIELYTDSRLRRQLSPGDQFVVHESRGKALIKAGKVREVVEREAEQPDPPKRGRQRRPDISE